MTSHSLAVSIPSPTTPTSSTPPTPGTPSTTVELCGHLYFLSPDSSLKSWTLRYVSLHRQRRILFVFNDEAEYRIHLRSFSASTLHSISLSSSSVYVCDYLERQYAFEVSSPIGNFFFAASDEAEMKKWVQYLMEVGTGLKAPEKEIILYTAPGSTMVQFQRKVTDSFAKYGFLQKKGEWNKAYKTRFFRTAENASGSKVLIYYESADSTKHKGIIPLVGAKMEEADKNSLEFNIVTPSRTFCMRAAKKGDKHSWMKVLTILSGGDPSTLTQSDADREEGEAMESSSTSALVISEDLYMLLGLDGSKNSSQHDISSAYKERAKEYHPDKNSDESATTKFAMISEAYNVLKHPGRRLEYDMKRKKLDEQKEKNGGGGETNLSSPPAAHHKGKSKEEFIPNLLSPTDASGNPARYNQRQKKTSSSSPTSSEPVQSSSVPVPSTSASSTTSGAPPTPSSSSPSTATSASVDVAPTPVVPVETRVGDDGQVYRKRVVKKRAIQNAEEEKKEETKTAAGDQPTGTAAPSANGTSAATTSVPPVATSSETKTSSDGAVVTLSSTEKKDENSLQKPSSPRAASSSSSSSSPPGLEEAVASLSSASSDVRMSKFTPLQWSEVSPLFTQWQSSSLKLFKLSKGFSSFKSTQIRLQFDSKLREFSLHWDSNKSSLIVIDANMKIFKGIKECKEWAKVDNQKKLPNPVEQVQWVFAIQSGNGADGSKKGADKEKTYNFCASSNEDFQVVMKVLEYVIADHKKKIDERLSMIGKG